MFTSYKNIAYSIFFIMTLFLSSILSIEINKRYLSLGGKERIHNRQKKPILSIDQIQRWMTFDYINHTFNLPVSYLQEKLSITSPNYPRITIQAFADRKKIESRSVLLQVQEAVHEYTASYKVNFQTN